MKKDILVIVVVSLIFSCIPRSNVESDATKARRAFNQGDYESAIVHATFALINDSNLIDIYALRARSYIEIEDCELALLDIQQVYNRTNQIGYLEYAGFCYNELKKYDKALYIYSLILDVDSGIYECYKGRARAYMGLGDHVESKRNNLIYLRYDSLDYRVWNSLGLNYSAVRQYDSAMYSHLMAIKIAPDRWEGYYNASIIHANSDLLDSALIYNFEALALATENREFLIFERGKLWYELNEVDSACMLWRRLNDIDVTALVTSYCSAIPSATPSTAPPKKPE